MTDIRLFTIGFTRKTAEVFFTTLMEAGVQRVLDVRLYNSSQLAGFAKCGDLTYFLRAIGGIDYVHRPDLGPTKELLAAFKGGTIDWPHYERDYLALMANRETERTVVGECRDRDCLLCSEPTPEHCHRRLLAEYLEEHLCDATVCHL